MRRRDELSCSVKNGAMSHFVSQGAQSWDKASAAHQAVRSDSVTAVSWGQLAPDDDQLGLLGNVSGLRVLDAGCGGGQNSVALALQGAKVTGVDYSARQLAHARALAAQVGVTATFAQSDITSFAGATNGRFDVVIAVQVMQYVENADSALGALAGLLVPGGRLVVSLDHPVRDLFFDAEEGSLGIIPVADYHEAGTSLWQFGGSEAMMTTHHRSVSKWVALVVQGGLTLTALLEPRLPAELLDELWPEDDALAPLRLIPHTLILVAEKRHS